MALFLSKEKQKYTQPIIDIGLCCMPDEKNLAIITCNYSNNCTEYYLFNKVRIWKNKKDNGEI